MILHVIPH